MSTKYTCTYEQLTGQQLATLDFWKVEEAVLDIPDVNQRVLELTDHQIKRGDVLHITDFQYRNDGMYLWDGKKLILQDHEIDEYGGVPKEFKIGEFLADHWMETLHRGRDNAWVDIAKYRDQLLSNLTSFGTFFDTDLGRFHIRFVTHSWVVAKMMFEKLVNENDLYCFKARDANTLLFIYNVHDELRYIHKLRSGCSPNRRLSGYLDYLLYDITDRNKPALNMLACPDENGYLIEP